jgi:deferrochelatase/peroxidase EfeB
MSKVDRRRFLIGAAAAGASVGFVGTADGSAQPSPGELAERGGLLDHTPFDGRYQAGILTPRQPQASFLALDSLAPDRAALELSLRQLTVRVRELTTGGTVYQAPIDRPPVDSGTLGPVIAPDGLTVTIGLGASLFDQRYGLAARRPARLQSMPRFANDEIRPELSHGDLLLQICANHRDTVVHTVRELLRTLHGTFALRWTIDGFQSADRGPSRTNSSRNLFAFRDGTANPPVTDEALMRKLVWTQGGGAEPAWTTAGSYLVVRIIRMHVEFWDRVGLREQQNMIGRVRDTGAPLGGVDEFQDPRLQDDPKGRRIPLDAHIRLANPRSTGTEDQRLLRRGYNYHRGVDESGALDQGLVFCAFNQDPDRQFATIQKRLSAEPMTDYISAVGGGYFFLPPGTGSRYGWIGEPLFKA